jgi:uncharacterized OB-fold protein
VRSGPSVDICKSCDLAVFPPRLVCWRCHASNWRRQEVPTARVEQVTVLRYRTGITSPQPPVAIATVATDPGPRIVVRVEGTAEPGDVVTLEDTDTGIEARRDSRGLERDDSPDANRYGYADQPDPSSPDPNGIGTGL